MIISPSFVPTAAAALVKTTTNDKTTPLSAIASAPSNEASKVTLQSGDVAKNLAYSVPKKILTAASPTTDPISQVMLGNLWASASSTSMASLFKGLGESLLGRFTETQADYQQSITESWSSGVAENSEIASLAPALRTGMADNTISLTLSTASKQQIELVIAFDNETQDIGNNLSVHLKSTGTLSEQERKAVASLASGFESALQSIGRNLTSVSPSRSIPIDVAGLLDFDPAVLSSVDLKVDASSKFEGLQAFALHADTSRRSLAMTSMAGTVSVDVDLAAANIRGTPEQQKAAIDRYLTQFDRANTRAQGQELLLGQFKSAFTQLQSNYPTAKLNTDSQSMAFSSASNRWFSGLADFQASMSGEFSSGIEDNGKTTSKIDYQVSQKTTVISRGNKLLAEQNEASLLDATIIKRRDGDPNLKTGNYDIYRINDSSTTTTKFTVATAKNGISYIESAHRAQMIQQLFDFKKMVNHEVAEHTSTPKMSESNDDLFIMLPQYTEL